MRLIFIFLVLLLPLIFNRFRLSLTRGRHFHTIVIYLVAHIAVRTVDDVHFLVTLVDVFLVYVHIVEIELLEQRWVKYLIAGFLRPEPLFFVFLGQLVFLKLLIQGVLLLLFLDDIFILLGRFILTLSLWLNICWSQVLFV